MNFQDVSKILQSHPDGKEVLGTYDTNGQLDRISRQKLTTVVINHFLQTETK